MHSYKYLQVLSLKTSPLFFLYLYSFLLPMNPFLVFSKMLKGSTSQNTVFICMYFGSSRSEMDEIPAGLTAEECEELKPTIEAHHQYRTGPGRCSSLLAQRVKAPAKKVWAVVRRFDRPQVYKHFVRSCTIPGGGEIRVGCLREVSVISGLPASFSTERLDILDDEHRVFGFSIIGGEHRLRNYRSVTTVTEFGGGEGREIWSVVLESYAVDVPEGNTEDDTRLFADTVVKLNLQKLATVAEIEATAAPAPAPPET